MSMAYICKSCGSHAAQGHSCPGPFNENAVSHPKHYNQGKIEVIEFIEDQGMGQSFCRGNAIKYIARAGKKDPTKEIEDLEKAHWYIERAIEEMKAKRGGRVAVKPNDMREFKTAVIKSGTPVEIEYAEDLVCKLDLVAGLWMYGSVAGKENVHYFIPATPSMDVNRVLLDRVWVARKL